MNWPDLLYWFLVFLLLAKIGAKNLKIFGFVLTLLLLGDLSGLWSLRAFLNGTIGYLGSDSWIQRIFLLFFVLYVLDKRVRDWYASSSGGGGFDPDELRERESKRQYREYHDRRAREESEQRMRDWNRKNAEEEAARARQDYQPNSGR